MRWGPQDTEAQRGAETSQGHTASQWKSWEKTPVSWLLGWPLVGDMQTVVGTEGARQAGRPQTAVREALLRTRTAMVPGRSLVCRLFRSRRCSVCRAWRSSGSAFRCTWPRNSSFRTRWFQIWEETEDRGGCWRWWQGLESHQHCLCLTMNFGRGRAPSGALGFPSPVKAPFPLQSQVCYYWPCVDLG